MNFRLRLYVLTKNTHCKAFFDKSKKIKFDFGVDLRLKKRGSFWIASFNEKR